MIKFTIDEKSYFIDDYLSINDYVKIYKTKDLLEDSYLASRILSIVSDCPLNVLKECEYQDIEYLSAYVASLMPIGEQKFIDRFTIDGVDYGFIPKWQELTFAEFVDIDTISNKPHDQILDYLHVLMAIMYRPIIEQESEHKFTIEPYEVESMKKRAELFKKRLDIKYVFGAQFFFIKFAKKYLNLTPSSLMLKLTIWEKLKMIWMIWRMAYKMSLPKRSGGSWLSTELQKMILQNTTSSSKRN